MRPHTSSCMGGACDLRYAAEARALTPRRPAAFRRPPCAFSARGEFELTLRRAGHTVIAPGPCRDGHRQDPGRPGVARTPGAKVIPLPFQRTMQTNLPCQRVLSIDTDQSPFLSAPEVLVAQDSVAAVVHQRETVSRRTKNRGSRHRRAIWIIRPLDRRSRVGESDQVHLGPRRLDRSRLVD